MSCPPATRLDENLRRWKGSGQPLLWVEWHGGAWGHAEWLGLLEALRQSEFWPLDPAAVGKLLSGLKMEWWFRRWQEAVRPRPAVESPRARGSAELAAAGTGSWELRPPDRRAA